MEDTLSKFIDSITTSIAASVHLVELGCNEEANIDRLNGDIEMLRDFSKHFKGPMAEPAAALIPNIQEVIEAAKGLPPFDRENPTEHEEITPLVENVVMGCNELRRLAGVSLLPG